MENCFIARNATQLDICLRLLYANNIEFSVKLQNNLDNLYYCIYVFTSKEIAQALDRQYQIMSY